MTNADMDEALDWLGRPVDCKACRYADRLADVVRERLAL